MIHQHNHSSLLGSHQRAVYYPPTGTGRDTYIMTDNGGTNITYRPQGVPQTGNYMKFGQHNRSYKPASYTRFQKYVSDGTGRDQYVVYLFFHLGPITVDSTTKKINATCSSESLETRWGTVDGKTEQQPQDGMSKRNKEDKGQLLSTKRLKVWGFLLPNDFPASMRKNLTFAAKLFMENDALKWYTLIFILNLFSAITRVTDQNSKYM